MHLGSLLLAIQGQFPTLDHFAVLPFLFPSIIHDLNKIKNHRFYLSATYTNLCDITAPVIIIPFINIQLNTDIMTTIGFPTLFFFLFSFSSLSLLNISMSFADFEIKELYF